MTSVLIFKGLGADSWKKNSLLLIQFSDFNPLFLVVLLQSAELLACLVELFHCKHFLEEYPGLNPASDMY